MNRTLQPISSGDVRDAVKRGDLNAIHIGDRVMVDASDLAAYVNRADVTRDEGAR